MTRQLPYRISFRKLGVYPLPRRSRRSWRKEEWIGGVLYDVTPRPGATFTRATFPPRGRGRGESLTSPRRLEAKMRAAQALDLHIQGYTWKTIALALGYKDKSGAYRAAQRLIERQDFDRAREKYYDQQSA